MLRNSANLQETWGKHVLSWKKNVFLDFFTKRIRFTVLKENIKSYTGQPQMSNYTFTGMHE